MLGDDRFTRGTINEGLSRGFSLGRQTLKALGYQPIGVSSTNDVGGKRPAKFNGGIDSMRIGRLEKGDVLFRFSASSVTGDDRYRGFWWFDLEALRTIRWVGTMQSSNFTETARTCLGVLPEWGDMANLVGGRLTADFWCFKGLTAGVKGNTTKMSGPVRTDVVQNYVPGGLSITYFTERHDDVLRSGIIPKSP